LTRDDARAAGLKQYDPGRPCKHGHHANRYVGNNDCVECSRIRGALYAAAHREEAKARASAWREANYDRHLENARRYNSEHLEAGRDRAREWGRANPERAKVRFDQWYANPDNAESVKQQATEWARKNPGRRREIMAKNRVLRLQASIQLTPAQTKEIRRFYAACPAGMQVDHIVPLRGKFVSGLQVCD